MSLGKTFAIIFIIVVLAVAGLLVYRDQGAKSPLQSQLAAAGSALATTTAAPSSGDASQGVIALANDPRRVAPPVTAPGVAKLDPATAKRYADALEQVEVDGCNANGTFAVRLQGEKRPRMVRSGQEVALPGGLTVTMRSRGYPNCRVMLYDGKVALGEIAGF